MFPPLIIKILIGSLIALGLLVSWIGWAIYRDTSAQGSWVKAQGVVDSVSLQKYKRDKTRTERATMCWGLNIRYTFKVNGQTFTSERYSNAAPTSDAEGNREPSEELKKLLSNFEKGAKVPVFYSPENPKDSVLSPSTSVNGYVLTVGVALLLSGLGLAITIGRRIG